MSDRIFSRPWWRKIIFSLVGKLLKSRGSNESLENHDSSRILLLLPVLRGDYLVATPLIKALRERYSAAKIAVVVTKPGLDIASVDPNIDEVLLYEKFPGWFGAIRRISRFGADIVFLPKPHPAFTESMLLFICGAKYRIGLSHNGHNGLLTHVVHHRDQTDHRSHTILKLSKPLGIDPDSCSDQLIIGCNESAEQNAENFFSRFDSEIKWLSVNISAANPNRVWQVNKWENLLGQIHQDFPQFHFVLLGAPGDKRECQQLDRKFDFVHYQPTKSFMDAVAIIKRTHMLISPDTGIVHATVAGGVPLLVLFNGNRKVFFRFEPLNVIYKAVFAPEGEPVGVIEVDYVFKTFEELCIQLNI